MSDAKRDVATSAPQTVTAPDLSVVIVSYNVREYLADCLRSLPAGCHGLSTEVLVVDNASRDGSADLVAHDFPETRLLVNDKNLGFSRAVNRAIESARGRYVLLLNPDTVVPPGQLARLVAIADRWPEVALVAPQLRDPVTSVIHPSFRPFPTWRTAFIHYTLAKPFLRLFPLPHWQPVIDRPTINGWLQGACLLIRRDLIDAIGGLDERFFLWFEDIEYCRRAIRARRPLLYTSEATVFHHEGKSVAQEPPSAVRLMQLQGLFLYLEGETSGPSWVLKALFKVLFLATIAYRLLEAGCKMLVYAVVEQGHKALKYRRRLHHHAAFLQRHTMEFLRL